MGNVFLWLRGICFLGYGWLCEVFCALIFDDDVLTDGHEIMSLAFL